MTTQQASNSSQEPSSSENAASVTQIKPAVMGSPSSEAAPKSASTPKKTEKKVKKPAPQQQKKPVSSSKAAATRSEHQHGELVQDIVGHALEEIQRGQTKLKEFSYEATSSIIKSSEAIAEKVNKVIAGSRSNVDSLVESGNTVAQIIQDIGAEIANGVNEVVNTNIARSRDFFNCRTFNDFVNFQREAFRANADVVLEKAINISELAIEGAQDAVDPINSQINITKEKINELMFSNS